LVHLVVDLGGPRVPDAEKTVEPKSSLVQLHLWARPEDLVYLRQIAAERDQTVSAVVRSIVRAYRRSRPAQPPEPDTRNESGTPAVPARYIRP
jgi:hypothetical protein